MLDDGSLQSNGTQQATLKGWASFKELMGFRI